MLSVQLIGDNSRTLHVLLAFELFDRCLIYEACIHLVKGGRPNMVCSSFVCEHTVKQFLCRPQIKRDYPLNLSI